MKIFGGKEKVATFAPAITKTTPPTKRGAAKKGGDSRRSEKNG